MEAVDQPVEPERDRVVGLGHRCAGQRGERDGKKNEQMRIDLERLWLHSPKTVIFITHSIDEAVLLSDRVMVMSPRPGVIERVLPVDLPRPRGFEARRDPAFRRLNDAITDIFLDRGVLRK